MSEPTLLSFDPPSSSSASKPEGERLRLDTNILARPVMNLGDDRAHRADPVDLRRGVSN
jgi:hypothetical protein